MSAALLLSLFGLAAIFGLIFLMLWAFTSWRFPATLAFVATAGLVVGLGTFVTWSLS